MNDGGEKREKREAHPQAFRQPLYYGRMSVTVLPCFGSQIRFMSLCVPFRLTSVFPSGCMTKDAALSPMRLVPAGNVHGAYYVFCKCSPSWFFLRATGCSSRPHSGLTSWVAFSCKFTPRLRCILSLLYVPNCWSLTEFLTSQAQSGGPCGRPWSMNENCQNA